MRKTDFTDPHNLIMIGVLHCFARERMAQIEKRESGPLYIGVGQPYQRSLIII